ncbi:helix-turn-helix domain-containing protein [Comamonas testosteroni]|uniref:winged helix-turn-helix transcriptional regulator n=1 Tax=Comamonas testosteroni TaxID=285 RepID=UPI0026E92EA6|nr:helix-turn-helix domain-containing protein [Comamonas testosteroni]WQD42348.1 helix-turn-helix domain-containing protein [Comamonas testosteroni]
MRAKGFEGMTCSVADVMGALGDRWGVLIMRDLLLGLARYDDLKQSTGVTNATLSDRLRSLEAAGLIERRKYQSKPDRYEYVLTERGQDISLVMQAFVQVGDHWNVGNLAGPPLQFVNKQTGHPVKLAVIDSQLGKPVEARDITVIAGPGADERVKWRLERHAGSPT